MSEDKISVAVYMICKDEAAFIERAVLTATAADEIVVCDTGSTDDTVAKLKALNLPNLKVYSIAISPWRFDDARNAALSLVSPNIDLCISLDADELLGDNFIEDLRKTKLALDKPIRINHSFTTYWNWDKPDQAPNKSVHYHERIHSRLGFRWVHPVHEKLVAAEFTIGWETGLLMIQKPDNTKNRGSYFELLKQTAVEDPADWKIWSFLSQEYVNRNMFLEADNALTAAAKLPDSDKIYLALRRASVAYAVGRLDLAKQHYTTVTELAPQMREAWLSLANFFRDIKNKSMEMHYLKKALECKTETKGYLRMEEAWNRSINKRLGYKG